MKFEMSLQRKLKRTLENARQKNLEQSNDENEPEQRSKFFRSAESEKVIVQDNEMIPKTFLNYVKSVNEQLSHITFSKPVDYIYNPTEYAFETHSMYINKYCKSQKTIMFLGMNPGPWGMSQTGVPFGEVNLVKEWLGISGSVEKPARELSCRPVTGFECHRSEVSGKRFWSLFKYLCGSPENFFKNAYMHNYCPIALMNNSGKNITPADLKGPELKRLLEICDIYLANVIKLLEVKILVAVGNFAEKRANTAIKEQHIENIKVVRIPHPSPRAVGSENWQENAIKCLTELDLIKYFNTKCD